ncbi:MAG: hypothetical protein K9M56_00025 [Victivallales bacterium]|nr:hypothetical protein [Victivallales bacterium]
MFLDGTSVYTGLLLVLIAGVINGSFAAPIKFIEDWDENNSWFVFGIFAFLLLPTVTIVLVAPDLFPVFAQLSKLHISILIFGGVIFGIGQIFLTYAFRSIGIGVAFFINIGLGVAGTSFFSFYFYIHRFKELQSHYRVIALLILAASIIAVCICKRLLAGLDKDEGAKYRTFTGIVCAVVAGICSIVQGLTFIYINPILIKKVYFLFDATKLNADILTWFLILLFAGIPFILYFLFRIIQQSTFSTFKTVNTNKNIFLTLSMALCFWISLCFYARANSFAVNSSELYQTSLWAIFMIFIIITSTIWSCILNEWSEGPVQIKTLIWLSVFIFAIAVINIALGIEANVMSSSIFK